uniref:Uncharacterized protein n=1 Tax=Hordeum vulgare subsp. vulgare TaxID=112509 RepID=A0A8I6Z107_HORVV
MANTIRHVFLQAVEAFCWFIGTFLSMIVLVLALIIFASTHTPSGSSSTPSPTPTSDHSTCNENKLHDAISVYMSYVVFAMTIAILLMAFVRKVADAAAKDHERVAGWEDSAYKAAFDAAEVAFVALRDAEKEVKLLKETARLSPAVGVVEGDPALVEARKKVVERAQEWGIAAVRAERLKPKEGIARLDKRWRIAARSAFFTAVCAHYIGSVCAGYASYCYLKIETKCVISSLTIFLFVLVGVVSTTIHSLLLWLSSTQN